MSEIHHRETTMATKPRLYRVTEAAKLSGVKVQVIFQGISTGHLRRAPGASGYGSLISLEDLAAYVDAREKRKADFLRVEKIIGRSIFGP